ncbi:MAG: galactose-1-phosphate uridylyltransferase [Bryobacteraceae bacterium]
MPELRKDPITGRWVIIASGRAKRPIDFSREAVPAPTPGTFCPFCPGNEDKTPPEVLAFRRSGSTNQPGWTLRVVPNKFPVLGIEGELNRQGDGMFDKMNGIGAHEVIIETPDHRLGLADLPEKEVEDVLWAFRDRVLDLRRDKRLRYAVLFKNHGSPAGATLEHTHSQLIALPVIPTRVREEIDGAAAYYQFKERCIFCDVVHQEIQSGVRLISETDRFVVIAPYASRFPFETWILPKRHDSHYEDADAATLQNLAWTLRSTLGKIDRVLEGPAYNFIIHTAPMQEGQMLHFHWHIEIMPKLTKVAGFEWATGFHINPTPPEEAAKFLREAVVVK